MNHRPRKRFGQNFLTDRNVVDRILRTIAPNDDEHIVEVGPGQGALTRGLLQSAGKLTVIEIDRDLVAAMQKDPEFSEVAIVNADVLSVDLKAIGPKVRLVGNLPYNISTPVLFWALAARECIVDMHFMLQKEVVDRMVALPGSKTYGRLSVMVQYACAAERQFTVAPGSFFPPPKVDSAIVRLEPRAPDIEALQPAFFEEVVKAAFAQRRKTLNNSLRHLVPSEVFTATGIDPRLRAEALSVEQFVRLSNEAQSP